MDMVRERELNVPIFQKQKSYQAQAVRRKYIKPPFEKRIYPLPKGLVNLNLSFLYFLAAKVLHFYFKNLHSLSCVGNFLIN